jgi:Fic family protein
VVRPLAESELAILDAQYQPILRFGDWPQSVARNDLWDQAKADFEAVRHVVSGDTLDKALREGLRAAAFDTGAIEHLYSTDRGLTRTVATQALLWEDKVQERDPGALRLFQAQLKAYELVLDAATGDMPISQAWIRRLHEELTAGQETYSVETPVGRQEQPLPRGEYKRYPNHVGLDDGSTFVYAPVDRTQEEMDRLVTELASPGFVNSHPLLKASYAHYALAAIHPFADGNGRVARALASAYTYRDASVPLLVLADQRGDYLRALQSADQGDRDAFVGFVFDCTLSALGMVTESLRTASAPKPEDSIQKLRDLMTAQGGLTYQELDALAGGLADELSRMLAERIGRIDLPPGTSVEALPGSGGAPTTDSAHFRQIITPGARFVSLSFESGPPARARIAKLVNVFVSTDRDESQTFLLEEESDRDRLLLSLRDVSPEINAATQHRLRAFAERTLGSGLDQLSQAAEQSFRGSGYGASPDT